MSCNFLASLRLNQKKLERFVPLNFLFFVATFTIISFIVLAVDTNPPLWQNQGTNDTDNVILQGQSINLTAQGKDDTALDWAWLSTNETGRWENKTGSTWQDSFLDSSKIDSSANITMSGGDIKIQLATPDYTTKACNVIGSSSSTGVKCTNGAAKCSEDSTYATSTINGTCQDGSSCGSYNMDVTNIFINGTAFAPGDAINVTCEFNPYTSSNYYAIVYNNGTGWRNKAYGSLGTSPQNISISFLLDNVVGTHYVRCIYQYYDVTTAADTCGYTFGTYGSTYSDTDDLNFTVTGYKSSANLTSTAITGINWQKFFANNTVSTSQGTNITYKILKASDNSILCSGLTGNGDDVSTCARGVPSIKLFANLTTSNTANTPILSDWNITWTAYNSPMNMTKNSVWQWSNFTWQNSSLDRTRIGWRIFYNDTSGNEVGTDIMVFAFPISGNFINMSINTTQIWWQDGVNASGYTNQSAPVTVYASNSQICSTVSAVTGFWSCPFAAPTVIGRYSIFANTSNNVTSNTATLNVFPYYGIRGIGSTPRVVYEVPFLIQDLNGNVQKVFVRVAISK
jgi:hypothetical protein